MKILKEGKLHKKMAWFCTCKFCGSELRILQGDPMATEPVCYNCDASQYYVRYICPVCRGKNKAYTKSAFPGNEANAEYKEIALDNEDREEIEGWDDERKTIRYEESAWINNRCHV